MNEYYQSKYKDDSLAIWIQAFIHQLDTHVLWSGKVCSRKDSKEEVISRWLFTDYFCDAEVLKELVKRGVVTSVHQDPKKHLIEDAWKELVKTVEKCRPYISIPLTEYSEEELRTYTVPNLNMWFEIVIDSFSVDSVRFSFSLWGYKYLLRDIELDKQGFYEITDRLGAKIRFSDDWSSLDEVSRNLRVLLPHSESLRAMKEDLEHQVELLIQPTTSQIQASCRSLFPLLERLLRNYSFEQGWKGKSTTMDHLIRQYETSKTLNGDTVELLRLIARPMRDYVLHGREMSFSVAKLLLAIQLEIFVRIANELETPRTSA